MRFFVPFLLFPIPALAWEFSPDPICTLFHQNPSAQITVTFDPEPSQYQLAITLEGRTWDPAPNFGMAFDGGQALTIGTDRQVIQGSTLSVSDSGFGNVLNGLEFNQRVTAFTPNLAVSFSLEGAAEPVQQFRACTEPVPSLS